MNETREQELAKLEMQLQEKKAQLEKERSEAMPEAQEKEALHQIVGGHIQNEMQANPEELLAIPTPQPELAPDEMQRTVKQYLDIALSSPFEAIKQVVKTKNPALIDAVHDGLVDNIYPDLVARKKIEQPT